MSDVRQDWHCARRLGIRGQIRQRPRWVFRYTDIGLFTEDSLFRLQDDGLRDQMTTKPLKRPA
jgi:hypothetical protein